MVDGRLRLAATWPPADGEASVGELPGRRQLPVRQAGELLGVLVVQEHENIPLTPVEERLFAGLAEPGRARTARRAVAGRAGPSARGAVQARSGTAKVEATTRRRAGRRAEAARARHPRRRSTASGRARGEPRLAHTLAGRSPERADRLIVDQRQAAAATIETITSLSRGIYPSLLVDEGLAVALRTAVSRSPLPAELVAADIGRYPAGVEAAAYFCCAGGDAELGQALVGDGDPAGSAGRSHRPRGDRPGRWCRVRSRGGACRRRSGQHA